MLIKQIKTDKVVFRLNIDFFYYTFYAVTIKRKIHNYNSKLFRKYESPSFFDSDMNRCAVLDAPMRGSKLMAKIRCRTDSIVVDISVHRALCRLFQPDTDGTRVSKCGHLSQQTRRLDPMLFQCWSSAVSGGPIVKRHWVKSSRLLGSTQVSVYTHPSPTIIFSPADQGTFSKTAGQSQAYYNT